MKKTILTILLLSTSMLELATADVIENDAYLVGNSPTYQLGLNSINGMGNGLFLFQLQDLDGQSVEFSFLSIAELNAVYETKPNDFFDIDFIENHDPLAINDGTFNSSVVDLEIGQSIFVGYIDDRNFSDGFDTNDYFGWAELTRTADGIELIGSATATSNGIVVGTTNQLPEPTSVTIIALLSTLVVIRRRR